MTTSTILNPTVVRKTLAVSTEDILNKLRETEVVFSLHTEYCGMFTAVIGSHEPPVAFKCGFRDAREAIVWIANEYTRIDPTYSFSRWWSNAGD